MVGNMLLIGRVKECARVAAALDGVEAGRADALAIHGEPGIGKSALLEYAQQAARTRKFSVSAHRAVESESPLPFAGLLELLRPGLPRLSELPAGQASALAGALALGPPVPADRFAVSAATLSLFAVAAEDRPLLILVDDAQWLDAASLDALLFVSRRLDADRVCLLFGCRDPMPRAIARSELERLTLAGLETEDARELLAATSPFPVATEVATRLVSETAGNPLALTELARRLSAAELAGKSALPEPFQLGPLVETAFSEQLSSLTSDSRRALVVAAASMSEAAGPILGALDELGIDASALDTAEQQRIVTFKDGRITFRHPLLRAATYHTAPPPVRRAAHRALAACEDRGRAAWHLAEAAVPPDEEIAALLEAEAVNARARSGFAAAGAAYEKAAQLSPTSQHRAQRLVEAARCFGAGGAFERSIALLQDASSRAGNDLQLTVEIKRAEAEIQMKRGNFLAAATLLLAAAAAIERFDASQASLLLGQATLALVPTERGPEAVETGRKAVALAQPGSEARLVAEAWLDSVQLCRGDVANLGGLGVVHLAERAPFGSGTAELVAVACAHLFWLEQYERARALIDRTIDTARSAAALGALPHLLAAKAQLEFRTGNWPVAHAAASEAVDLDADTTGENPFPLAYLARIEAALGLPTSRAHALHAIRIAEQQEGLAALDYAYAALGLLELGARDAPAAIAALERVAELESRYGLRDPSVSPWRPDLIEAYTRAARPDDAKRLLNAFEAEARRTGRSWPLAAAHRCRGMLATDAFDDEFEQAMALHRQSTTPFELARTQLAYGEQLRRTRRRRDARVQLRAAIELFAELRAQPWLARAQEELAATGETSRRGDKARTELTPQETQVATLIADGATNKEAASRLFISPRTIDAHLSRIYRKLGIHSREQLAEALASSRHEPAGSAAPMNGL